MSKCRATFDPATAVHQATNAAPSINMQLYACPYVTEWRCVHEKVRRAVRV